MSRNEMSDFARFDSRYESPPTDPELVRIWQKIQACWSEEDRLEKEYTRRQSAIRGRVVSPAGDPYIARIHEQDVTIRQYQQDQQDQKAAAAKRRQEEADRAEAERISALRSRFPGHY